MRLLSLKTSWIIGLIVLLSVLFRVGFLPNVRHGYDQAYQAYLALEMLDTGKLLTVGQPSSVFLDNPPLMAYLLAGVLLIWRSIWAIYIFIAVLNGIAAWFVYDVTRQLYNRPTAIIAAFLYAVSPWLVHFGRMPWTQGLLPLFMAVLAWGVWPTLAQGKVQPRRFLIGLLSAVFMTQTYILAFAILPVLGLIFLLLRHRVPKRPFFIGTLIFVLATSVFVSGIQREKAVTNSTKATSFLNEFQTITFDLDAIEHAIRFVTGEGWNGQDIDTDNSVATPLLTHLSTWTLLAALLGGIGLTLYETRQHKERTILLLLWFILPIIGFGILPFKVHPHYLLLTVPAGQAFAAHLLDTLAKRRPAQLILAILLAVFGTQFVINTYRTGQHVAVNPHWSNWTTWQLSEIARLGTTLSNLDDENGTLLLVADTHAALPSSVSGRFIDIIDHINYPDFLFIPAQSSVYYAVEGGKTADNPYPSLIQQLPNTFQQNNTQQIHFLRTLPQSKTTHQNLPQVTVNWQNETGWQLLGYDLDTTTNEVTITTYWRVEYLPDARFKWFISPFYQLLDNKYQKRANISEHGIWGYKTETGDLLVERTTIPIADDWPKGTYSLILGLNDPVQGSDFFFNSEGRTPTFEINIQIE